MLLKSSIVKKIASHIELKITQTLESDSKKSFFIEVIAVIYYIIPRLFKSKKNIKYFDNLNITRKSYLKDVQIINSKTELHFIEDIPIGIKNLIKIISFSIYLLINYYKFKRFKQILLPYFYYIQVKSLNFKKISFHYYSFVPEISAFLELLNDDIKVHLTYYEYASFIDESFTVKADKIILPNIIVKNYIDKLKEIYLSKNIEAELVFKYYEKAFSTIKRKPDNIVFISSGWAQRIKNSKIDKKILINGNNTEIKLLNNLLAYAEVNKNVSIFIKPHYARGIESEKIAEIHYKSYLQNKNIKLIRKNKCGKNEFEQSDYNLAITVISNVFWDRLKLGLKTVLYDPPICKSFLLNSSLNNLIIKKNNNCFEHDIEKFLRMDNKTFFNLIFN
jgi:hypothetical protein